MEVIHPDGAWFLMPNPGTANAHRVPASPQDAQLKTRHGAWPMDNMLSLPSHLARWHNGTDSLLAKSECSPRRQPYTTWDNRKGKQWTTTEADGAKWAFLIPHSSGSSLERPAYWQTTHTHTHTHTHTRTPKLQSLLTRNLGSEKNGRWKGDDCISKRAGPSSPCGLGGKSGGDTSSVRRLSQLDEHPGGDSWAWREATTGKYFLCQHGVLAKAGDLRITQGAPWAHQGSFTRSSSILPCLPTAPSFVRNMERQNHVFCCVSQA